MTELAQVVDLAQQLGIGADTAVLAWAAWELKRVRQAIHQLLGGLREHDAAPRPVNERPTSPMEVRSA